MVFGDDGYLYLGVGDGPFNGDPFDNGQNMQVHFSENHLQSAQIYISCNIQ